MTSSLRAARELLEIKQTVRLFATEDCRQKKRPEAFEGRGA